MCYQSILIKSNAIRPTYGNRPYMFVPCGNCFACRSAKSDSYYIRTVNEMKSYNPNSIVLFVLLTYNDMMLPKVSSDQFDNVCDVLDQDHRVSKYAPFELQDGLESKFYYDAIDQSFQMPEYLPLYDCTFHPLPCFNVHHIDLFFKHLRSYLKKQFGFIPRYSYFLVAENGDEKKRPHYHIILFLDIPRYLPNQDGLQIDQLPICKSIVRSSWSQRFHCEPYQVHRKDKDGKYMYTKREHKPVTYTCYTRMIPFGFVMFDEENGKDLVSLEDCNKVSRYLSQYLVNDPYFEEVHKSNLDQLSPRNKKIYLKRFGPFRLTSQHYGLSVGLGSLSNNDVLNCIIRLDGKDHPYRMPLYYQRYVYSYSIPHSPVISEPTWKRSGIIPRHISKDTPYRAVFAHDFVTYDIRKLPMQRFRLRQSRTVFKNDNYVKMKKHLFPQLYSSLCTSFGKFKHYVLHDLTVSSDVYFKFNSLSLHPAFNILSRLPNKERSKLLKFYKPTLSNLTKWINRLSVPTLVGYYISMFNHYSYEKKESMESPLSLQNLTYTHKNLKNYEFIFECYRDFVDRNVSSPFDDHGISSINCFNLRLWMVRFEYLCVLFQAYQHVVLADENVNKINDWNKVADSLNKCKFKIRPHNVF